MSTLVMEIYPIFCKMSPSPRIVPVIACNPNLLYFEIISKGSYHSSLFQPLPTNSYPSSVKKTIQSFSKSSLSPRLSLESLGTQTISLQSNLEEKYLASLDTVEILTSFFQVCKKAISQRP